MKKLVHLIKKKRFMKKIIFLFLACTSSLNIIAASAIAQLPNSGDHAKNLAEAYNQGVLAQAYLQGLNGGPPPPSTARLSDMQRDRLAREAAMRKAENFATRMEFARQNGELAKTEIEAREGDRNHQVAQAAFTGLLERVTAKVRDGSSEYQLAQARLAGYLAKETMEARDGKDYKLRDIAQNAAGSSFMNAGQAISANNYQAAFQNLAIGAAFANISTNGKTYKSIALTLLIGALPILADNIRPLIPSIRKDNKFVRPYYPKNEFSMMEIVASAHQQIAFNQHQESMLRAKKLELEVTSLERANLEKIIAANNPEKETDEKKKELRAKIKTKAQTRLYVLDAINAGFISLEDAHEAIEPATKAA